MRAIRRKQNWQQIDGFKYQTDCAQGTSGEKALQEIQANLSGGQTLLSRDATCAHLYLEAFVDSPHAVITLWVPPEDTTSAEHELREHRFELVIRE